MFRMYSQRNGCCYLLLIISHYIMIDFDIILEGAINFMDERVQAIKIMMSDDKGFRN